jgi:hypothetical protein
MQFTNHSGLRHSPAIKLVLATALAGCFIATARGETFAFGGAANSLLGATSKIIHSGGFEMNLVAGPAGSGLWESGGVGGMGVDSTAVLGPGGLPARFDRINGSSEFVEFSFDAPGLLTGIDFDGVKDESFEYFILESTGGLRINFFDSAANITIPGAIDNAVLQGAVSGPVVYLLEGNGFDDETNTLAIPFTAGQVFRITYAEVGGGLGAAFEPILAPNGARLQGITVAAVPEPTTLTLAGSACMVLVVSLGRRRIRNSEHFIIPAQA